MPSRARTRRTALSKYTQKRDFGRTPEPDARGGKSKAAANRSRPARGAASKGLLFCIQKHDATRLHYDFRLELDGTLKSWAVPKGPSLDPTDKRLAVHVEDHPLDYADFEGVIPAGQYGGGTVLVWDLGTWEPEGDAAAGYRKGHLIFQLAGRKLSGRWSLVRMGGRAAQESRENWLLIKGDDEHASRRGDITRDRPESVATQRVLQEIAAQAGGTPRQRQRAALADGRVAGRATARATPTARTAALLFANDAARPSSKRRKAGQGELPAPAFVEPQLCTLVTEAPEGDEWLHEIKYDGYRMLARIGQGRATLWSRNRKEWTDRLPTLIDELAALPCRSALLDGEVVVPQGHGRTSFEGFRKAIGAGSDRKTAYQVFDLLHLDGDDLRELPLLERKQRLQALLGQAAKGRVRYSDHVLGQGRKFFEHGCRLGLEGSVAKRADAPYRSGRHPDWIKIRCGLRQEFAIVGYTPSTAGRDRIGSLILAVNEGRKGLRYAGRVGTGFSDADRRELLRKLSPLRAARPPVEDPGEPDLRDAVWTRPSLVGEVSFTEWTSAGRLRHPSFHGLREDKTPADVVRETPLRSAELQAAARHAARGKTPREANAKATRSPAAAPGEERVEGVRITHPERVLYADAGLNKLDLARYYSEAASLLLPHAEGRPLALVRCPEGQGGTCFFQKHPAAGGPPPGVERVLIREKDGTAPQPHMLVRSAEGLVGLVQNGVLELHLWGSHAEDVERPDRMVIDLDPSPELPFARVIEGAREVRARLEELELESFVMTTGGKGLHVVTPLRRTLGFDELKAFTHAFALAMAAEQPARYLAVASKARRTGRIFVDYLRNGRGATAICPYSTRARPGAPIAVPLRWDELKPGLHADPFTVANAGPRLAAARKRDPWTGYVAAGRQQLSRAALRAFRL